MLASRFKRLKNDLLIVTLNEPMHKLLTNIRLGHIFEKEFCCFVLDDQARFNGLLVFCIVTLSHEMH